MHPVPPAAPLPPRLRLRVSPVAETLIRSGHPWLFADSVRGQNREGQPGEFAVVYDRNDAFLAIGLYDPGSPIRLRVLHSGKPATLDAVWWTHHLAAPLAKRASLFDGQTDGYRYVNGESDGWPGLVLDRYAESVVMKLYTAAWIPHVDQIASLVRDQINPARLILRLSRNIQEAASVVGRTDGQALLGRAPDQPVVFHESGLQFEADLIRGQKTGFFLDQRENRRLIESVTLTAKVLNAFSFTGGFSLYAARGGASAVTSLDISSHALAGAKRNFALNASDVKVAQCRHDTIQADVFEWLPSGASGRFNVVILDPPSLARRETERHEAIRAYQRLAVDGIKRLEPGGLLVAASCSAHVSAEEFFDAVRRAARSSGRHFNEWKTTNHAADHPATIPEAHYLKCIYLRF